MVIRTEEFLKIDFIFWVFCWNTLHLWGALLHKRMFVALFSFGWNVDASKGWPLNNDNSSYNQNFNFTQFSVVIMRYIRNHGILFSTSIWSVSFVRNDQFIFRVYSTHTCMHSKHAAWSNCVPPVRKYTDFIRTFSVWEKFKLCFVLGWQMLDSWTT